MKKLLVAMFLMSGLILSGFQFSEATFPGTNGKIHFQKDVDPDDTTNFEVHVMNSDGSFPFQLTNDVRLDGQPYLSPDGTKIAFQSDRITADNPTGDLEIFTMDPDGSNIVQLTDNTFVDNNPSWSPNGQKIIFGSNRDGNNDVWIMDNDGMNPQNLSNTAAPERAECPNISPDGLSVAFCKLTGVPPGFDVWTMDSDPTTNDVQVNRTPTFFSAAHPDWSPDGSQIVFPGIILADGTDGEIWIMDADGMNPMKLNDDDFIDGGPNFSPDGTKVAFHSQGRDSDNDFEIYTMNANDGSDLIQITFNAVQDSNPEWGIPPIGGPMPPSRIPVGGELIPLDTSALLVTGAQMNAAWMIPVIVSAIGFAIVIARKF